MDTICISRLILFHVLLLLAIGLTQGGRIFNPGTNYEVDEDDIVTYLTLGKPCDPKVQSDNTRKDGICKATLFCHPKTKLCDCEDIGPYVYAAQRGKCKNIVGSACYKTEDCVQHAECTNSRCVCRAGKTCLAKKTKVKPL